MPKLCWKNQSFFEKERERDVSQLSQSKSNSKLQKAKQPK